MMAAKIDPRAMANFPMIATIQMDLMTLALTCGLTNVATFMFANSDSWQYFPWIGVNEEHHTLSHGGDNDAALILGADPGATMPQPGIEHLARIPTIVLDPKVTHTSRLARVHITTAVTGISAFGTSYRMDEIPLPLRPALQSPYPTDEEVIRRIRLAAARKPVWTPTPSAMMAIS